MSRTHLITGVGGQDGILLARHLLASGDRVVGTVTTTSDPRLVVHLSGVALEELDVRSTSAFATLVQRHRPDVVHNLAALSSVGASWDAPALTDEVNHEAVLGMLSVIGSAGVGFVQASSSEIFGPVASGAVDSDTPLNPVSPYAEAKARAHVAVAGARAAGARATNLVLFGHTSPLHDAKFVLPTITRQAVEVASGRREALELRDPSVTRDWGSAADFVRAFALAAAAAASGDWVIATGRVHRLADVAEWALAAAHADPSPVRGDPSPVRDDPQNSRRVDPNSRRVSGEPGVRASGEKARRNDFGGVYGDPSRAAADLGWRPRITLRETIEQMVRADLARLRTGVADSEAYLDPA
ncbi:GDP-mannose 4,6-dehydratase [Nocardioides jensenii]|uniref:GDP-mannose 4,6-dehydratase n=1 Tax=Nocardioides jensenii TaxID=1843 RepID=UPI000830314F|nr:GDP-mannose 4,6-dehydratase [Nocardioides jensenii]